MQGHAPKQRHAARLPVALLFDDIDADVELRVELELESAKEGSMPALLPLSSAPCLCY